MRVEFQSEGGIAYFPGLNKPVVIDSATLPTKQATKLQQLLDSANFFELPEAAKKPPKGAADYRTYTISVEDGKRHRTIRLHDPIEDTNLQALIAFLQEQRGA